MFRTKHLFIIVVIVVVLSIISIAVLTRRHTTTLPVVSGDAAQFVEGNATLKADVRTDTTKEDAREALIKELKENADKIPSIQQNNDEEKVVPTNDVASTSQASPDTIFNEQTATPTPTSTEEVL